MESDLELFPVTSDQWDNVYGKLGALYKLFKTSNMPLNEYNRRSEEISSVLDGATIYYPTLLRFRSACRFAELSDGDVKDNVRHEGTHMHDVIRVAKRMQLPTAPRFRFAIQLLLDGDVSGVGPAIEVTNLDELIGDSKDLFITFWDAVLHDHTSPSQGDKCFL